LLGVLSENQRRAAYWKYVDRFITRNDDKAVAAEPACRVCGLTQREAAKRIRVGTGAAISRRMKKLSEHLPNYRELRKRIKKAGRMLDAERSSQGHHFGKYQIKGGPEWAGWCTRSRIGLITSSPA